jgi:uncharacterized phage-like protein YoqJ
MTERDRTCCFSGYRPGKLPGFGQEHLACSAEIKDRLRTAVLSAVREGYVNFISGMSLGFDLWAAETVLALREQAGIFLTCAVPFPKQAAGWDRRDIARYDAVMRQADFTYLISKTYTPACYQARNRFMVDNSARLICFYDGQAGGTANTVYYARMQGIAICNLAR